MLAEGASYTFTSADGLPQGMKSKVTVTNIRKPDAVATQRPLISDVGIVAARSAIEYSDVFKASGVANYGEGAYHAPDNAWWLLTQARRPNSEEARRWNSTEIAAGSMAFDVSVETYFDDGTGSKRISVPLVAIDGEASDPLLGSARWRDSLTIVTDGDPWEVLQKIDSPQVLASGKARFETTSHVTPVTSFAGTRTYSDVRTEFTGPRISAPIIRSENATKLDVTISSPNNNGGRGGVAMGMWVSYDTGDAPAYDAGTSYEAYAQKYGYAVHLLPVDGSGPWLGAKKPKPNLRYDNGNFNNDTEEDLLSGKLSIFGTKPDSAFHFPIVVTDGNDSQASGYTAKIPVKTGGKQTYVAAWIDLNRDGVFDNSTSSPEKRTATVTSDGVVEFDWNHTWTKGGAFAVRVRASHNETDVSTPEDVTWDDKSTKPVAQGGEVEDLQMFVVYKKDATTYGLKNQNQYSYVDGTLKGVDGTTELTNTAGEKYTNKHVADGRDMFGLNAAASPATFSWALNDGSPNGGKSVIEWTAKDPTTQAVQGVYAINELTGKVTFTPAEGFVGTPTPATVQLLIASAAIGDAKAFPGKLEAEYQPVVVGANGTVGDVQSLWGYDNRTPGKTASDIGQPVTVTLLVDGDIQLSTLKFADRYGSKVTTSGDGKTQTLDVPGEGTWLLDRDNKQMTFTPAAGFTGTPTPVEYTGFDSYGMLPDKNAKGNNFGMVTITYKPIVTKDAITYGYMGIDQLSTENNDGATGQPGKTPGSDGYIKLDEGLTAKQMFPGLPEGANGAPDYYSGAVYKLIEQDKDGKPVLDADGKPKLVESYTAKGPDGSTQGTYTIDNNSGVVTFDPVDTFVGNATPAVIQMTTSSANKSLPFTATYTPKVLKSEAVVIDAGGVGEIGQPITGRPPNDPAKVDVSSYQFVKLDGSGNPVTGDDGKLVLLGSTLEVDGKGTWIAHSNGQISFVPKPGFTGSPTPVKYTAKSPELSNEFIQTPATITVTYPQPTPIEVKTIAEQGVRQVSTDFGDTLPDGGGTEDGMLMNDALPGMPKGTLLSLDLQGYTDYFTKVTDPDGFVRKIEIPGVGVYQLTVQNDAGIRAVEFIPDPGYLNTSQDGTTINTSGQVPVPVTVIANTPSGAYTNPDNSSQTFSYGGNQYTTTYTPYVTAANLQVPNKTETATHVGIAVKVVPTYSDPNLDKSTLRITGIQGKTEGVDYVISEGGTLVEVKGEGKWVLSADGSFTFTPCPDFLPAPGEDLDPTPLTYTGFNANGARAKRDGVIGVDYPVFSVQNAESKGSQGVLQEGVLAGTSTPATGSLMYPNLPDNKGLYHFFNDPYVGEPSANNTKLTVPDVGVYEIDTRTGEVTFTPVENFVGIAPKVNVAVKVGETQQVFKGATYTPTVTRTFPAILEKGKHGDTINITVPYTAPSGMSLAAPNSPTCSDTSSIIGKSSVVFAGTAVTPDGGAATVAGDGKSITVPNEGTWTVGDDGNITFTPDHALMTRRRTRPRCSLRVRTSSAATPPAASSASSTWRTRKTSSRPTRPSSRAAAQATTPTTPMARAATRSRRCPAAAGRRPSGSPSSSSWTSPAT